MKNGENKRLHIQMIENVINRMSSNSFLIKGWSLTILGGLITVYLANINKPMSYLILLLCLFFCLIFWVSDTFYLREERYFRNLYETVRKKDEKDIDFSMKPIKSKETFLRCMWRPIFFNVLLTNTYNYYSCDNYRTCPLARFIKPYKKFLE